MENDTLTSLFGPLNKKYCLYFYFFSVTSLIFLVFFLISGIVLGITKKLGFAYYFQLIIYMVTLTMVYIQNRLFYSMCIGSL